MMRWGSAVFLGWLFRQSPRSLLDNAPLRALLENQLDFGSIDRAIAAGHLRAISVTASGYTSGESLAFFQGSDDLQAWRRAQRVGVRTRLTVANSESVESRIVEHSLDVGLLEVETRNPNLQSEVCCDDELVVICTPDYPLHGQRSVSAKTLLDYEYVSRESDPSEPANE